MIFLTPKNFQSLGEVTIIGEGLHIFIYNRYLVILSSESSLAMLMACV